MKIIKPIMAGAFIALATAAIAHTGVKDPNVKARMDGMSAIGQAVKTIGTMMKGETAFDGAAVDAALAEIENRAARIPERFEENVITPKSEARPTIWESTDDFNEKALTLETLAATRQGTVSGPDDLRPLMGEIGATCKSCHSEYRD
ncbi:c-type cytochrome [Maritimibacter dapengensis]|uniref:Cytochrome c n=1 Tax=Maritimibacter dapengensis TaxID=2836868 RepID=A0ABS6T548_9RHOB|nr:cytochrome c [Maritimibacter dapengensis]MBV7379676.1 cytochrome c [Maritimibacter dapengensis]